MSVRDEEEAEIEEVEARYRHGEITLDERNKQVRAITRWYRDAARDAAEQASRDAYEREMERW